jgi:hypothetical protein
MLSSEAAMNETATDTPPVFLRPAVDDAFFGRGDFELRQEEFRAVVRVRPRPRTHPAMTLPLPLDEMPTVRIDVARPPTSGRWSLPQDLIPTWIVDVPNPVEVLPTLRMDEMPTDKERVGTFVALSRQTGRGRHPQDGLSAPPWDYEEVARWRAIDIVGLPAVIVAVAGMWAAAMMLF